MVATFMADPTMSLFVIGDGYRLDLAAAVRAHEWASVTVPTKGATEHLKRAGHDRGLALPIPTFDGERGHFEHSMSGSGSSERDRL
ncbi:hypothetical protein [Methylobacterium sp. J-068]|uniref:hypothetical protein n=1 Tax=Methylobacterium sp. J-068 TaxID=2836649 RepID=UPI001FBB4858|nr:hypothetical protein [Methylobacterium sp. J-068]MCJ2034601.1 hypothetical protein [Methylobacterium sp. J-068]